MNQNLHPSCSTDTDSFPGFQPWITTRKFDVKQKRKLLIDQLSLPTPKQPCLGTPNYKNHSQEEEEEQKEGNFTKMGMELVEVDQLKDKDKNKKHGYGHEEDLLEFENNINIIDDHEPNSAAQNLLLPKHSNHDFVLSSGRWRIEPPGAESKISKPTIDEEFEDYFSMLLPSFDS